MVVSNGLITVPEAADLLRVSPARAYELVRTGVLPPGVGVRLGRQVRIDREKLESWLAEGGRGLGTL